MAVIDHSNKEVKFKLVYCGTPLGGKTSNLQYIHGRLESARRGELVSINTSSDRTLFFDFLPVETAVINGYKTKFLLYTVPGQVAYNATRQLVLKGVDGIVFVADSDPKTIEANIQSFRTMVQNLRENGTPLDQLPAVIQYNKRDLPDAVPVAYLDYLLKNQAPPHIKAYEACANTGWQVFATLNALADQVLRRFYHASRGREPSQAAMPNTPARSTTPLSVEPPSFPARQTQPSNPSSSTPV
jgi:hypothetical protein